MNVIQTDCFAYSSSCDDGCNALKKLFCKDEKCKFYKRSRDGKYPDKTKQIPSL